MGKRLGISTFPMSRISKMGIRQRLSESASGWSLQRRVLW